MEPRIGTSGWHYEHWRNTFYPPRLPSSSRLGFYAEQLDCVEINSTFYRLPSKKTVMRWLAETPANFRFTLKASRYISHQKKLKDCGEPLARLVELAECFGEKLGPVLFQLPPHWQLNTSRLTEFLNLLPTHLRYAMEFRDPSWHCRTARDLLTERGIACCQYDLEGVLAPFPVSGNLVYLRLHGPGPEAYCGSYGEPALEHWAARLREWQAMGSETWVFFNNDQAGYAPANAQRLRQLYNRMA